MKKVVLLSISLTASIFIGCGGGSSSSSVATTLDDNSTETISQEVSSDIDTGGVHLLKEQTGTQSYLFYGEVNPKALGDITNVRVFDPKDANSVIVRNDDTTDIDDPAISTTLGYNPADGVYSDLYVSYLSYVSNGVAYVVDMRKEQTPVAVQNSSATHLSDAEYEDILYFGTKQYLVAFDEDRNSTVLITPDMKPTDEPIDIGDRKFLTITYPAYGEPVDGYLLYNNETKMVQSCNLDVSSCIDIMEAGSRDFEGASSKSVYSAFLVDDKLYRVNRATGESEELSLGGKKILDAYGTTDFNGDSFYFISDDYFLYRVNLSDKSVTQITNSSDDRLERIRSYTDNWVIFGSDTILMASKKDGSSGEPIIVAETTQTKGLSMLQSMD